MNEIDSQDLEQMRRLSFPFGTQKHITSYTGRDSLIDGLHLELSGDFRKAVILWTYDPAERDARLANETLKSNNIIWLLLDKHTVFSISMFIGRRHNVTYFSSYPKGTVFSLDLGIFISPTPRTTGFRYLKFNLLVQYVMDPINKILVSLVSSYRYDKELADFTVANMQAAKLHDAMEEKKLDDGELIHILSTRNIFQLRENFKFYEDNYGKSIPHVSFLYLTKLLPPPDRILSDQLISQDIIACGDGIPESALKVAILCIF